MSSEEANQLVCSWFFDSGFIEVGVYMSKFDSEVSQSSELIHTTIGDLVEAVTQIALEAGKTEEEGYKLASLTLENIFRKNKRDASLLN
jgi:hypothetical protein